MKSEAQLRQEFYDSIALDVTMQTYIGNPARLQALGNITAEATFPLIVFYRADVQGDFAFGVQLESESVVFETRVYTDVQDADAFGYKSDFIANRLKTILNSLGYMHSGSSAELLDSEINKHVSVTRWELTNA